MKALSRIKDDIKAAISYRLNAHERHLDQISSALGEGHKYYALFKTAWYSYYTGLGFFALGWYINNTLLAAFGGMAFGMGMAIMGLRQLILSIADSED